MAMKASWGERYALIHEKIERQVALPQEQRDRWALRAWVNALERLHRETPTLLWAIPFPDRLARGWDRL